jgi:polysaccharide biosynthesis transport protein
MNLQHIIEILKARRKVALGAFFVIFLLVIAVTALLPKRYTAVASVVIDSKNPDPISGMILQGAMLPSYIATQLDILRSERVTQRVIQELRLNENAQMRDEWRVATQGVGTFESWLSEALQKNLEIIPSRDSSVINVAYTAVEPQFAAVMANAFVKAYIDTTLDLRIEPARQYNALFEEQVKISRSKLEDAQNKLSAYQREKGIVATDERLDIENARLSELSNQLVALQAISAESASRKAQAGANAQEVLNNPVIAGLKADVSRQEAKLKEMSATLGLQHPQVMQMQESIKEMKVRIDAEVSRVTSSMGINNSVNQSREAQVKAALDAQRDKVLKMKEQRDEASMLLADVASAQRAYDTLQVRVMQTQLETQVNQTNVSVLKVATAPPDASSPKVVLNVVIGFLLAGMVGGGLAVLMENLDKRIRGEDELELAGGQFLGVMPKAADLAGRKSLPFRSAPRLTSRGVPRLLGN